MTDVQKSSHSFLKGGLKLPQTIYTAAATVGRDEACGIILADTGTTAAFTLTLGMTAVEFVGHFILLIDGPTANWNTDNLTLATAGAETIDGGATLVLNTDSDHRIIFSDGTNFQTVAGLA